MKDRDLWTSNDLNKFLKYKFEGLRPKNLISIHSLMWLLFLVAIYIVFDKNLPWQSRAFWLAIIIFIILTLRIILDYISGRHRFWWKQENNILTRAEIKRLKQGGGTNGEKI